MGVKFKCKRCKQRFDSSVGREAIEGCIDACEKPACPLKRHSLKHIPKLPTVLLLEDKTKQSSANDEKIIEVYEEIPIGGLISYKEMRKNHGW